LTKLIKNVLHTFFPLYLLKYFRPKSSRIVKFLGSDSFII